MASTNKTTNLKLSKFLATDKPAFLQDYNGDMTKIDTAVASRAMNENPNFTGTILQANRPIGEVRTGFGNIAAAGSSCGVITSGPRFISRLTAIYQGNRTWLIQGTGAPHGSGWSGNYLGFSLEYIAGVLELDSKMFKSQPDPEKVRGKWIKYFDNNIVQWDVMQYGTGFKYNDGNMLFGRMYNDRGDFGTFPDSTMFVTTGAGFNFDLVLTATMD